MILLSNCCNEKLLWEGLEKTYCTKCKKNCFPIVGVDEFYGEEKYDEHV